MLEAYRAQRHWENRVRRGKRKAAFGVTGHNPNPNPVKGKAQKEGWARQKAGTATVGKLSKPESIKSKVQKDRYGRENALPLLQHSSSGQGPGLLWVMTSFVLAAAMMIMRILKLML